MRFKENISKSFLNIAWNILNNNAELINNLSLEVNLDKILITVLVNRGFDTVELINTLLDCKLKNTVPDPSLILDMNKAVSRVTQAILNNEKVLIFGDYDVDGMTSTSLLLKALQFYNLNPEFFIPNRLNGSYGINKEFINLSKSNNVNLIIITDSGIGAINEVEYANQIGIDIIIFDHHPQLLNEIPNAIAVVDPNRVDQNEIDGAKIKYLCAAGVVFMFLIALNRNMLLHNYNKLDLIELVPISAIGTIGDLVPLIGINRAFVKYLIKQKEYLPCIKALIHSLDIKRIQSSGNIAFTICPVLNASGRLGEQNKTVELLMTNNYSEATSISYELIELNEKRKSIEKEIFDQALDVIYSKKLYNKKAICVYDDMWHEGVIGIIAGKLKDRFNKPVFVISFDEKGFGKGSARSIPGLHIGEIINEAVQRGILLVGGGHEKAGGLSIHKENINKFVDFLDDVMPISVQSVLNVDCILPHDEELFCIFNKIKVLEPFGTDFDFPLFGFLGITLSNLQIKDDKYIRFYIGKYRTKCMLFNTNLNTDFIKILINNTDALYDIIGQISYSEKFGLTFIIKDIRLSNM
ncbi:MAG: single-stranded-DNA-specific exonuclease RecJ [Alphaproteobacteria bacterium]|nr:single-stranded-DNA-specific exonuclease RecJ [Alphaproteobacteria bacterium]